MDFTKEIDYTTISSFINCPRKGYFRHIRNWSSDTPESLDLIFGRAWHSALEYGYNALKANETISHEEILNISTAAFMLTWRACPDTANFDPMVIFPKSPTRAIDMLHEYWARFLDRDRKCQILGAEIKFDVPLGQGYPNYIGKLDAAVIEPSGNITVLEHKTAKYMNDTWLSGFDCSYQVEGYLTGAHVYFSRLPTVTINGALCQKSKIDFLRHSITRMDIAIERFISEMRTHVTYLLDEYAAYSADTSLLDVKVLPYFPRNAGYACTMYFRKCPYMDLCLARMNPETWQTPPTGFRVETWEPFKNEA